MDGRQLRDRLEAALAALRRGRHRETVSLCTQIVAHHPAQPDALGLMGAAYMAMHRTEDAARTWRKAAAARPEDAEILGNLAVACLALDRAAEASDLLARAIELEPGDPLLHANLGAAQRATGRLDAAESSLRRALSLQPDHVPALFNLGNTLFSMGRHEAAAEHYLRVTALSPRHTGALTGLALTREHQGDRAAASAALGRCLAIEPDHLDACYQLGVIQLMSGDFAEGWANYRARHGTRDGGGYFRDRLGPDLAGKRILVVRDQGLGDELFFLRFVPELRRRGARVSYLSDPRLRAMLARAGIAETVIDDAASAGAADLKCWVGDLPHLLGPGETGAAPPSIPLAPLRGRIDRLRARLAGFGPPPYVGVTWRAGVESRFRLFKTSPPALIAAALEPLDARVVALQRAPAAGEADDFARALGREVLDLSALNGDLEDMVALVSLLDDQVCVSNTNVHFAAALGRTCHVLVRHPPEFRWMATGDRSPWFPDMPLYRQRPDGDWGAAFDTLGRDLAGLRPRRG